MAESHHRYTGILLIVFALLILLGAIFFTIAQVRVMDTDEYKNGEAEMNNAKNNLLIAYILGYIASGIGIVLAILYFGHVTWGIKSEIPHAILFILLFLLIIVSGIFAFIALDNINKSNADDKKGSEGWIWAGEIAGLIAIIVLIISGAWRAQYVSSKDKTTVSVNSASTAPGYQAPDLPPAAQTHSSIPAVGVAQVPVVHSEPTATFTAPATYTVAPNVPTYPTSALAASVPPYQ